MAFNVYKIHSMLRGLKIKLKKEFNDTFTVLSNFLKSAQHTALYLHLNLLGNAKQRVHHWGWEKISLVLGKRYLVLKFCIKICFPLHLFLFLLTEFSPPFFHEFFFRFL